MTPQRHVHWHFAPGRLQRLRLFRRRLADRLAATYWFPHLPLALGVAGAGLLLLVLTFGGRWHALLSDFPFHILNFPPASMPYLLVGVAMLTMSIGLAFRSRFAWVVALVLTVTMILVLTLLQHGSYRLLLDYDAALLIGLLFSRRYFNRTSVAAGTLFAVASSLLLLIYAVFGSYYLGQEFKPHISDLSAALYYAMVTMSTVGYGDITPQTVRARLFTVSLILFGVAVFATSISAIIGPMVSGSLQRIMIQKGKRMKRSNHYIIVGATALAFNTYRELKRRKQQVTLILSQEPDADDVDAEDVIVGDANSLEILRRADADQAQAVLAMRADDSENAFVVLAVKELKGKAKTVAAINDSKHVERMKLVQPDIVIAPQVLGGELLAMALSGEAIDGDFVMDRFLHFDRKS